MEGGRKEVGGRWEGGVWVRRRRWRCGCGTTTTSPTATSVGIAILRPRRLKTRTSSPLTGIRAKQRILRPLVYVEHWYSGDLIQRKFALLFDRIRPGPVALWISPNVQKLSLS